jgi:hypothetical protein
MSIANQVEWVDGTDHPRVRITDLNTSVVRAYMSREQPSSPRNQARARIPRLRRATLAGRRGSRVPAHPVTRRLGTPGWVHRAVSAPVGAARRERAMILGRAGRRTRS